MKKITITLAALALSFSMWAQGVNSGMKFLKYERYESAMKALSNENSEEGKYYLGLAHIGKGETSKALSIFKTIEDSEYGQAGLARVAFLNGNVAAGNEYAEKIVKKARRKQYYKYKLAADAITYTKGGNLDNAIEWYQKSMKKSENPETLVALGDAYLKKGDPVSNGEASRNFERAAELGGSSSSLGYSRLGLLMYQARNYTKALEYYNKAKEADVQNPLPYRDLANAYYYTGNYKFAKENIEKYLKNSDASEEDLYQYINVLFLSKDHASALTKINEFVAKNPNHKPYLYRLMGYSQYETKDYNNALTNMTKYFENEKNTKKHLSSDYLYKAKSSLALAATDSTKAASYIANANTDFEQAVALYDDSASKKMDFYKGIAQSYQDAKDYAGAAKWYGRIVKETPEPASLDFYNYGSYLYYAKDYQKAIDEAFTPMYNKYEDDRLIAEYWRSISAAAIDNEAKTGLAADYYKNWLSLPVPEGKSRKDNQLYYAYQYLTFYAYNTKNKAMAVKYAQQILDMKPDNKFAKQILDFFKK